jgi:hypothetical protein
MSSKSAKRSAASSSASSTSSVASTPQVPSSSTSSGELFYDDDRVGGWVRSKVDLGDVLDRWDCKL